MWELTGSEGPLESAGTGEEGSDPMGFSLELALAAGTVPPFLELMLLVLSSVLVFVAVGVVSVGVGAGVCMLALCNVSLVKSEDSVVDEVVAGAGVAKVVGAVVDVGVDVYVDVVGKRGAVGGEEVGVVGAVGGAEAAGERADVSEVDPLVVNEGGECNACECGECVSSSSVM